MTLCISLYVATSVISSSHSISACISLSQHKEMRDLKLDNVRMILLDDGVNPCKLLVTPTTCICTCTSLLCGLLLKETFSPNLLIILSITKMFLMKSYHYEIYMYMYIHVLCFRYIHVYLMYFFSLLSLSLFLLGSLASSDMFFEAYTVKGLNREALCPCAGSPETLTLSLRR